MKPKRTLTNPIGDLWTEVTNDRASWTDAVFWFVFGVAIDTLIEICVQGWLLK